LADAYIQVSPRLHEAQNPLHRQIPPDVEVSFHLYNPTFSSLKDWLTQLDLFSLAFAVGKQIGPIAQETHLPTNDKSR
jgi:hypothetical protein